MIAIKHPSEAALALHAGGDLGPIAQWRCRRHLERCQACREEVAAYQGVRRMVAASQPEPEFGLSWDRLAADMQANIRRGLEAGETAAGGHLQGIAGARFTGFRAAVALASLTVVVAAGLMWRHPAPPVAPGAGQSAPGPRGAHIQDVSYSANAEGSTGESYVDPVTGDVTIRRVW